MVRPDRPMAAAPPVEVEEVGFADETVEELLEEEVLLEEPVETAPLADLVGDAVIEAITLDSMVTPASLQMLSATVKVFSTSAFEQAFSTQVPMVVMKDGVLQMHLMSVDEQEPAEVKLVPAQLVAHEGRSVMLAAVAEAVKAAARVKTTAWNFIVVT